MISGTGMAAIAVMTSFPADSKHASTASATFIFLFNMFYPIGFLGGNSYTVLRSHRCAYELP